MRAAAETGASANPMLPFVWRGAHTISPGASSVRISLDFDGDRGGLTAFDQAGNPVAAVDSVISRQVDPAVLRAAVRRNLPLHRLAWSPVEVLDRGAAPLVATLGVEEIAGIEGARHADLDSLLEAVAAGAPAPELVVATACSANSAPAAAARATAAEILALAQQWAAAPELAQSRLCLLTKGAVAVRAGEDPDLATAPVWGLLRSAHSEHPGRFALLDTDGTDASTEALAEALALGGDEPQLALREGRAIAPRLVRAGAEGPAPELLDPQRTILITGATGALGTLLARHLVEAHSARHLLLASRRGEEAPAAAGLREELESLGAEVSIVACDAADRSQLEELLAQVPAEHPLGAVFHCAGLLDDGVLESLDAERLERVMRPKADAAWHLHELTVDAELSAFVLFSSAAGILGGAAQANYAAANAFLDALAAHRQAEGLPGTSLAWGLWGRLGEEVEAQAGAAEVARFAEQVRTRLGFLPIASEQGLAMLDAALGLPDPLLAPVAFDAAVLRSKASAGTLPAQLASLVRLPATEQERGSLAERLGGVPERDHEAVVLDLVRSHVAAVLGHASPADVDPAKAFIELGFDSLAAVELRNRLVAASGLELPPTLVFDYPSATALAGHLLAAVDPGATGGQSEEDVFREELARLPLSRLREAGLLEPLKELVLSDGDATEADGAIEEIDAMDLDDLVRRTLESQAGEPEAGAEG